ncbi:corticotropin-releasing factor receptor 2-like isoform X1 [Centruroides sculpturatus]|uniref:corticotropin-releasing factor receptor 2-like isoform X1 n=1 Tax=Centruroides sculpturatus TaxID=218467 RepID=UPI000C6DACFE|nr:corticotropin-releasing factor receptor 2-like isoform X1 [Centruroides sculpturatus]
METTTAKQYHIDNRKECLLHYNNISYTIGTYCEAAWDKLYCWPPVPAGEVVTRSCRSIFTIPENIWIENKDPVAYRICNYTGQWHWGNWTNYSECLTLFTNKEPKGRLSVSYILFIGSLLSLILLSITLFIFSYFRCLQCSRLRVHRNLVVALMIHSFLLMIIPLPILFENSVPTYHDFDWFCKTLLTLKMYAATASVNWMFVEGLLLYSSISVFVFQQDPPFKLYYFIGWGAPGMFVITWAICMNFYLNTPCWRGYGKLPFIWIVTGPMITALVVNTIFLFTIVRILITKIRATVSIETKQVRKAVKATVLLFPLLGITHLLFCINPQDDGYLEQAYMITNALLQSCQGIFVAVLYCFLNSEVQTALKQTYIQALLRRHPNIRCQVAPQGSTTHVSNVMDSYTVNGTKPIKQSPYRQPGSNNLRYSNDSNYLEQKNGKSSSYPLLDTFQISNSQN